MNVLIKLTRPNLPKIFKLNANIVLTSHYAIMTNFNVNIFHLKRRIPHFEIPTVSRRQIHAIDDHEYVKMSMEDFLVLTPIDGMSAYSIFNIYI